MSTKTEIWKHASEVYADISELTPQQALAHVYGINNITAEVRNAVITLISAGSQASKYFQDNITPHFDLNINSNQKYKTGQQLDEYELLEALGHGGMSQVFKAKRINSDQQTYVAIKIFAPKENSKELLKHFINEQKILSGLSHPNIVKMLHSGMTSDETAYLVMELIEQAQPLDTFAKTHRLGLKQKIKFITQCADALAYSHANLIIHRDLKPDNILVNQNHELKIVDFGIAKLINNDIFGNKTTIMALTPSYAAPEQINSGYISVKTDVFSLAVVALDLLTDEPPLPKDRLLKSCANDERYIDNTLKTLKTDKDLKNILQKALEQQPEKRYLSMQSFADDLTNWLNDQPVNATAQSFIYRMQKFAKRRSALFATLVSFFAFLIIGSIISYKQYQQIKIEAQKAQIVKQFMLDSYKAVNPNRAKGVEVSAKDLLESSAQKLSEYSNLDSQVHFELLQTLGIAYGTIGITNKATELLKQSLTIQPEEPHSTSYLAVYMQNVVDGEKHSAFLDTINMTKLVSNSDKARVLRVKAQAAARDSDFKQAMGFLNKSIDLNKLDNDKTEEILAKRLLAEFYFLQSEPRKGINLIKSMLADINKDKSTQIPITIILGLKSDLGTLYNDIGDYQPALEIITDTIKQVRVVLGNKDLELSKLLNQLSGTYRFLGEMKKAQDAANESYQITLEIFGENNIQTAASINTLAVMAYQTGDIPKAIEYMQRAVNIFQQQQSADYADTLELKTNLAALLNISNRHNEALILIREVYNIQKEKLGLQYDSTIYSQQILARTLAELGQFPEALNLATTAEQNARKFLGLKNPLTVGAIFTLASINQRNNQPQAALKQFLEIYSSNLIADNNPKYPLLLQSIAELYAQNDELKKADKFFLESIKHNIMT
ncbi:Serine/threonine protein kinase PrkC, regulator of stationary phase, partial [hydrothermal vent metagenome]